MGGGVVRGLWGYMLVRDRRGWPVLTRGSRLAVFMAGMGAVLLSAGLRFDGGDFVTLLVVMAGIKHWRSEAGGTAW